jgi:hypothetical protein
VPEATNEHITTEREADQDMLKSQPPVTVMEENKAKLMFHTNQMLRNLAYYNSTPAVRRMIEAMPVVTMSMQILVTLLEMTGRVQSLSAAMKHALVNAHGNPEPLNNIKSYDTGYLKVDIYGDSSLIFHVSENTPGASVVKGKVVKPKDWKFSVEGIHKLVKDYISMHCMVDATAQGGASAGDFVKNINELWSRSPVEMGADKYLLRVAVLCWTCNDCATWNRGKSGRFKAKPVTPEMRQAAEKLRKSLERYPVGIIIGPGASTQWNLEEAWATGGDELLDILKPAHFHCWQSNSLWSAMERCEDGWHGAAHAVNEQLVARHIARAVDYCVSAHYLLKAFQAPGEDGDRYGEPLLEERVSEPDLLAKMAEDWEGLQLSPVEPTEQAMAQVQAEKKVAVAKELREDRPETKGIALLRPQVAPARAEPVRAPAQADAAAVPGE